MTISSATNKSGPYTENGVTDTFAYEFKIEDETHVKVVRAASGVETVLTLTTDYTVTGVGDDNGGNVVINTPVSGSTLTLVLDVPFTQELDLENQGAYFAESVEAALDLAVQRDKQLQEQINRAVIVPVSADVADLDTLVTGILTLEPIADDITTVAGISGEVVELSGLSSEITAVAGVSDALSIVASGGAWTYRGAWSASLGYSLNDVVENGGSIWLALRPSTGVTPTEGADWTLFLPGVTVADGSVTFAKLTTNAFAESGDTFFVRKSNPSGFASILLDPLPADDQIATVGFFRNTDTSADRRILVYRGDGTSAYPVHRLSASGSTYFNALGLDENGNPDLTARLVAIGTQGGPSYYQLLVNRCDYKITDPDNSKNHVVEIASDGDHGGGEGPIVDLIRGGDQDAQFTPVLNPPSAGDMIGCLRFTGRTNDFEATRYAGLHAEIVSATPGSPEGLLRIKTIVAGVYDQRLIIRKGIYTPGADLGDVGPNAIGASILHTRTIRLTSSAGEQWRIDGNADDVTLDGLAVRRVVAGSVASTPVYITTGGAMFVPEWYNQTSASAANAIVSSAGGIVRSTSAAKYKTDVEDIDPAKVEAFLNLRPIHYRSLCEVDDPDAIHTGIIADQAHELGLSDLVQYGPDGEVEGFSYERGLAYALAAIQQLQKRIAA